MNQFKSDSGGEQDLDRRSILLSLLCSLFLCPVAFHLISDKDKQNNSFEADFLAAIIVITLSALLVHVINSVLKSRQSILRKQQGLKYHQQQEHNKSSSKSNLLFSVFNHEELSNLKEKIRSNHRKIDPKYFNPRFIYHELTGIWGTTYHVILWTSFYVVGGTIGASERLVQKIRTKYRDSSEQHSNNRSRHNNSSANRSDNEDGESSSYLNFLNLSTTSESSTANKKSSKGSLKKSVSSWTKKSFESTRKKFSRIIGSDNGPILSMAKLGDANRTTAN